MTPIQASKKSNESKVYANLKDKRKKRKPKYKLGDLVRTADKRIFFQKVIQQIGVINFIRLQK